MSWGGADGQLNILMSLLNIDFVKTTLRPVDPFHNLSHLKLVSVVTYSGGVVYFCCENETPWHHVP